MGKDQGLPCGVGHLQEARRGEGERLLRRAAAVLPVGPLAAPGMTNHCR